MLSSVMPLFPDLAARRVQASADPLGDALSQRALVRLRRRTALRVTGIGGSGTARATGAGRTTVDVAGAGVTGVRVTGHTGRDSDATVTARRQRVVGRGAGRVVASGAAVGVGRRSATRAASGRAGGAVVAASVAAVGRARRVAARRRGATRRIALRLGVAVRVRAAVSGARRHLGAGAPRLEDAAGGVTGRVGTSSGVTAVGVAASGIAGVGVTGRSIATVVVAVGR